MAKVVFEHVSKKFGSGKGEVTAVNDLNISICGDGANLDSGYSFIVGGDAGL